MEYIPDILGWIGTALIVGAYLLISLKKVDSHDISYQAMNFFGSLGVGVNVFYQMAWPAFLLQVAWGSIALFFLIKILRFKK